MPSTILEVAPLKFLLFLLFVALLWAYWRLRSRPKESPPPAKAEEPMVVCAHCGVYLPQSESLAAGPHFYCCATHLQAGSGDQ